MGLFGSSGLKSLFSLASLIGQDIVARSITLTGTTPVTAASGPISAQRYTQTGTTGPGYTSNVNTGQYAFFDTNINGGIASAVNSMTVQVAGAAAMNISGGRVTLSAGYGLSMPYSDGSGTPGNAVNNSPRGKNAIAAGASSVTITNNFVAATSTVLCVLETIDGTLTFLRTAIPGAGSFVLTGNANATGNVVFSFVVFN